VFIALSVRPAAACLVPAVAKLRSHPKMLASASDFGIPWACYRLIGVAELGAAAGVLIGLSWAALCLAAAGQGWSCGSSAPWTPTGGLEAVSSTRRRQSSLSRSACLPGSSLNLLTGHQRREHVGRRWATPPRGDC
jgi:hypothetical protein